MKTLFLILLLSLNAQAKNSFQVSLFGITHHGIFIPAENAKYVKSKLTQDGVWAYNPQFNFTKYNEKGDLFNVSFVVDCYQKAAINLALGKRFDFNDHIKYGYIYGVYFRKAPSIKDTEFRISENYQLIPTVAGILQYKVTDKITLRLTANYIINFFDVAFEF